MDFPGFAHFSVSYFQLAITRLKQDFELLWNLIEFDAWTGWISVSGGFEGTAGLRGNYTYLIKSFDLTSSSTIEI